MATAKISMFTQIADALKQPHDVQRESGEEVSVFKIETLFYLPRSFAGALKKIAVEANLDMLPLNEENTGKNPSVFYVIEDGSVALEIVKDKVPAFTNAVENFINPQRTR